ncbi:cytochrome P450 [Plectosphaerella plurivora]|uniref:Cytochrome P450 n=1 Tax=Plectosphaerella plurivora TaxID=936078 RepID=A0A9P8V4M0_9PEZI|nr:cytochrome P450 [Plectosphaerella plurivora]
MSSFNASASLETLLTACKHHVQQRPVVAAAVLASVVGFLITLRRVNRLRRPIPGIPYNPNAISYMLGDVPDCLGSPDPWTWWAMQGVKHNSPLTQVFMRPFQQPWVLVSDPWLATDLVTRRAKEFDRSEATFELFDGVIPGHQLTLKTSDPHYKKNKELVRELMTPSFINEVTAPQIYHSIEMLVDLWNRRIEMAKGRPFEAGPDIHHTALDVILGASFGFGDDKSQIAKEIRLLAAKKSPSKSRDKKEETNDESLFEFQPVPLDEDVGSFTILIDSIGKAVATPSPRLFHFLYRNLSPTMRRATVSRDRLRNEEITKSLKRRNSPNPQRCALDQLLTREDAIAKKDGREPNYRSQTIMSELLGYLGAGYETTSSVLRWTMKYLVQNQEAQKKLRDSLHAMFPEARKQNRPPTLEEILKTNHHYVDAVIEESLRCSMVLPLNMRQAVADTQILGIHIPKGTSIMVFGMGPGMTMPPLKLDDKKAQDDLEAFRGKVRTFDENNMGEFLPERWLKTVKHEQGREETVFDANSGPAMAFGQGPRGCFGKRMAMLQIKVFLTLVFWSFELLPVGEKLSAMDQTLSLTRYPTNVYLKLRKTA